MNTWLRAFVFGLHNGASSRSPRPARPRRSALPLRLESLEDRVVPTVSALGTNLSMLEGVRSAALVATFTDSATTSVRPSMNATINWGDGTSSPGTIIHLGHAGSHLFVVTANKAYAEEGRYSFQVSLADGNSSATTHGQVTVADAPLVASGTTMNAVEGMTFSGTVAVLTDLDPHASAGLYKATINWGNGQTSAGTITPDGKGGFLISGSHTYATPGLHLYNVTVNDRGGSSTTTQGTIHVLDAPLQASGDTFHAGAGAAFGGVVATFSDADPNANVGLFTATIHWGDGHTSTGTIASAGKGSFIVSGGNTYASVGMYGFSVTIHDVGGSSVTAHGIARVTAGAITALGTPVAAVEGTSFSGTVATFVDSTPGAAVGLYTATINWGDGQITSGIITATPGGFGVTGQHTFLGAGSYPLSVHIASKTGSTASGHSTASVSDALLTASAAAPVGTEGMSFSGTVATFTDADPNASAGLYTATITWGDGHTSAGIVTGSAGTGFTVSGSNTYATLGSYGFSVMIHDKGGSSVTAQGTATAQDAPLSATWVNLQSSEGSLFSGVLATFSDPGSDASVGLYTATITWGDGHTSSGTVAAAAGKGSFIVSGSNTYTVGGSYGFTVTISDKGGSAIIAQGTASVSDLPLTGSGVSVGATEGSAFTGTVATFTDADPNASVGLYTATITWGDGHTSAGTVTASGKGTFAVSGSNTYATAGSFPLSVQINDKGGSTITATTTATVQDAALSATGQDVQPTEGTTFTGAVATFSDADPNASVGLYTATITWGDGHTSAGVVTGSAGTGFTVSGSNTYATAGSFPLSVQINDAGGSTTTATSNATVHDAPLTAVAQALQSTEGTVFNGVVATFADADPNASAGLYTATITWGDGHTSAGTIVAAAGKGTFTVSGSNTYAMAGSFPLSVQINDQGGSTITATSNATVQDAALSASAVSVAATAGVAFTGPVATFSDAAPGTSAGLYTATITWGDGHTSTGTVTGSAATGFTVSGSNTYASAGTFTPSVHIVDAGGSMVDAQGSATVAPGTQPV